MHGVGFFRIGGARPQTPAVVDYIHRYRHRFGARADLRPCWPSTGSRSPRAPTTLTSVAASGPLALTCPKGIWRTSSFDLWRANRGLYGRGKLWKAALRRGLQDGRDQAGRLMRITGITGVRRGRRRTITTRTDPSAPRHLRSRQAALAGAGMPGSIVGSRFHLRANPGRILLRLACDRCVLPDGPGLTGSHLQDH